MDWKESLTSVSEHVFPGISHKLDHGMSDREVLSNLPLQMALYFNVIFVPIWTVIIILFLFENYHLYSDLYKFIIITLISTILIMEILRLYLGYEGNLKDKIPEMAGFWMLSLLLQFPLQGFLLFNPYVGLYVLEVVVQGVMFSMLCVQLISGYCALKYTATQQMKHFRMTRLGSGVNLTDLENKYRLK